jgi:hypothetical protein
VNNTKTSFIEKVKEINQIEKDDKYKEAVLALPHPESITAAL